MKVRLLLPWALHEAGDEIDAEDPVGRSLVALGIAHLTGPEAAPREDARDRSAERGEKRHVESQ